MSDLKIFTDNIEPQALEQINTLIKQPAFSDCKIRIMPDIHAGAGCVIGFTADLGDKVIPNIVGVDIGCGMLTINLGIVDVDLEKLDNIIRKNVPSGRNVHSGEVIKFEGLKELYCYDNLRNIEWIDNSLGTLGGGNHFIELDVDSVGGKYLIIHSGSRNLGKQVAEIYQQIAIDTMQGKDKLAEESKKMIDDYKSKGRHKDIQRGLRDLKYRFQNNELNIPKELCYLTGENREKYLHDMKICQEFATENRKMIAYEILDELYGRYQYTLVNEKTMDYDKASKVNVGITVGYFETIHNYIENDTNMVRKGAISAKKNELLLIPINMRDGCIVGLGKGNADWNMSAPHGAGRIMSRNKAKESISLEDFEKSMDGIYTTSVNQSTIDESPMAYKPMEEIVENIKDTVDILKIIKPIYNFKASE